jgi:predicted nucleic acid-binding protein
MTTFVDTSAFLAVLNKLDVWAVRAARQWRGLLEGDGDMVTSSYVVLETISILQNRIGLDAVRVFNSAILPVVEVVYVSEDLHRAALSNLLVANRRALSLVDCSSFEIMRRQGIHRAFAFDPHFREQGFELCGEPEL